VVPFRSVIENHVQEYFDAGPMQGFNQIPEFIQHCQRAFP
jgi:hypothetical protein